MFYRRWIHCQPLPVTFVQLLFLQFSECRTFLLLAPIKPKRDNPACFTRVWNPNQLSAEASKTQRDGTQYLNDDTLASADAARRKQNRKPAPRRQTKRPAPQCSSCHQRTGVAESASWRWSGATTESQPGLSAPGMVPQRH
ncbi:hypothetical protein BKA80DRAFT_263734 [Phyllosticta citrichinensis]